MPATDRLKLADWLEFLALVSPDGNASFIDLERAVRREGIAGLDDDEAVEEVIQEVANEIDQRALSAQEAYPFQVESRSILLKGSKDRFVPYVFCLCISALKSDKELDKNPYPRRMFERLSCVAARNYIKGEVVRFGSPRDQKDMPKEFSRAVDELCKRIGEGLGFRAKKAFSQKDDAIDIVAWRDFPDRTEGKIMLLGNCASGHDWGSKLDEMQPQLFCEEWMLEVPVSMRSSVRAFFIPRRIERSQWKHISRRAGMVFDRCRIAHCIPLDEEFKDKSALLEWVDSVLRKASA